MLVEFCWRDLKLHLIHYFFFHIIQIHSLALVPRRLRHCEHSTSHSEVAGGDQAAWERVGVGDFGDLHFLS
jgi:hypothetical protein